MKNLTFLFLSFFCFANSQTDSIRIVEKLNKLEQTNKESIQLIKKIEKVESENKTMIFKIKVYIQKLTNNRQVILKNDIRPQAIKAKNINEPIAEVEINIPDGYDSIRGGFFYRLFHKNNVYVRPYKLKNDEKIYLD